MANIEERRSALLARMEELEERLREIETELDAPHTKDWDDQAIEREGDEVMERMGTTGQAEIRKIQAALQRMDAGEYGFCVDCGDTISDERLDVLPYTPFCKKCAAAHDPS
ncbi:MAG: TraR/DksA family transcriptional regulator [Rhodobacteraceae bacterium]|nr:TraR/DksA family transcriptional regulator [Paracoccaceae bacterium]